jgi:Flp pilus assembly protein TadD
MRAKSVMAAALAAAWLAGCQAHPQGQVTNDAPSLVAAREALDEGEAGTALAIARGVLATQPRNLAALTQAGNAEAVLGDRIAAENSYRQALAVAPRDIGARLGMAKLKIRDDVRGAEVALREILAQAPRDPTVLNDLGYVLDLQERHAEAQSCYAQAIAVAPTRMAPRVNLALSLALSGQADRGEAMLRDLVASSRATQKARLDFAVAQVIAGHDKDAAVTLAAELPPEQASSALRGLEQLRPAIAVKN